MTARASAQDSRLHSKTKKKAQRETENDEDKSVEGEEKGEEESCPSHFDTVKSVGQSRKAEALLKQLEAEAMTQKQLEEKIAELSRKNKKINKTFAELLSSRFDVDEGEEELHTPKTTKRRKRSMWFGLVDSPKVI